MLGSALDRHTTYMHESSQRAAQNDAFTAPQPALPV